MALLNMSSCLCQTNTTHLVLPIFYSAMFLAGLPGNALSLWVFMVRISGKTPTHIYLINLGISNLLLCFTMPFIAAYYAWASSWVKSSLTCQLAINVLTPVLHNNIAIGVLILTWLALSRFATLIQHNFGNRPSRCTKFLPRVFFQRLQQTQFALAICLGTWAFVGMGIISTTIIYSVTETTKHENGTEQVCYSLEVEVGGAKSQGFAMFAIIVFFLCLLLVLSAYTAMIRHFHRNSKSKVISDRQKVYTRVVRNIMVIQGVLVICLLPYHIYKAIFIEMIWSDFQSNEIPTECHPFSVYVEIKNCLLCLAVLRSSTDPFIYYLLDKTFKKNALGLFLKNPNVSESQLSKTPEWEQLKQNESGTLKDTVTTGVHLDAKQSEEEQPALTYGI